MPELTFLVFWIFLLFFWNFLARVGLEKNSGVKFVFLFLGLSHPILDKNNAGNRFLNFFAIFSLFSSPGRVWTEFGTKFFFFSFSAYRIPFWLKIMLERSFLIFWFLFFSWNFLARIEYERNSGLKFFSLYLGLSHPVSAKNLAGKRFFNFLNFFAIFFIIFFPRRVWTEFGTKILFSLFRPITSHSG